MRELAVELGGIAMIAEHRFYGGSLPFNETLPRGGIDRLSNAWWRPGGPDPMASWEPSQERLGLLSVSQVRKTPSWPTRSWANFSLF